jgi:hypothetical protein
MARIVYVRGVNGLDDMDMLSGGGLLEAALLNEEFVGYEADDNGPPLKKTRNTPKRVDYWETNWGKMVNDPDLLDPWTNKAKKFRRRFRITFSLFQYLVGLCKDINLFGTIFCFNLFINLFGTIRKAVPVEIKILIGLRMLARGNCGDDIEEMSGIKQSSVYYFFKEFIEKSAQLSLISSFIFQRKMNFLKLINVNL